MGVVIPNKINCAELQGDCESEQIKCRNMHGGRDSEQNKLQKKAWGSLFRKKEKSEKRHGGRDSEQNKLRRMAWGLRFRTTEIAEKGKEGRDSEQKKIAEKCMGVAILNKYIQKNAWGVAISNRINLHRKACFVLLFNCPGFQSSLRVYGVFFDSFIVARAPFTPTTSSN